MMVAMGDQPGGGVRGVRFDYLDLLRAALMVFGIPFHAALPFTGQDWAVTSSSESPFLTGLAAFIHEWRLPTFFFIAGFFASLILDRRRPAPWLRGRAERLGIPFVSALVLIIPLQVLLISRLGAPDWPTAWADFGSRMTDLSDIPIGHIWFLLALLIYCVLLVALLTVWPGIRSASRRGADWLAAGSWRWLVVAFALAIPTGLAASAWRMWDVGRLFGGLIDEQFVLYLPAFALGVVMGWNTPAMARILAWPVIAMIGVGILTTGFLVAGAVAHVDGAPVAVAERIIGVAGGLVLCVLLLKLASLIPGASARPVRWLVDASLVIYLVHHPLVILVSGLLIEWDVTPPILTWVITCSVVLVLCGVIYEVINRFRPMRFLFTGRSSAGASLLSAGTKETAG